MSEKDDTDEAARATVVAATIDSFVMMLVLWLQGVHATSNCVRTWRQQVIYLSMSGERCNFASKSKAKATADSDTAIITANNEANANLILS